MRRKWKTGVRALSMVLAALFVMQVLPLQVMAEEQQFYNALASTQLKESEYGDSGAGNKRKTHSFQAGRGGTVLVGDYTRQVTLIRQDTALPGNVMPVDVQQVYRGNGTWSIGYAQRLGYVAALQRFSYTTQTGACILFADSGQTTEQGHSIWKQVTDERNEDGGWTLTAAKTPANALDMTGVTLEDANGQVYTFNTSGLLHKITSPTKSQASITIAYDSQNRISSITDGAGRSYRFTYRALANGTQVLASIACFEKDGAPVTVETQQGQAIPVQVSYGYGASSLPVSVTYPDGKSVRYTYNANQMVTSITNVDGSVLELSYAADNQSLAGVTHKGWDADKRTLVTGNRITITQNSKDEVTFADSFGRKEVHQFDAYGLTTVVRDENGSLLYTADETEETGMWEGPDGSSDPDVTGAKNLLRNGDFREGQTGWTAVPSGRAVVDKNGGARNPALDDNVYLLKGAGFLIQSVPLNGKKGDTFCFGGWAKADATGDGVPTTFNLIVRGQGENGSVTPTLGTAYFSTALDGWQYQQGTFTLEADCDTLRVIVQVPVEVKEACFDGVALYQIGNAQAEVNNGGAQTPEAAPGSNYVTNGDFRDGTRGWAEKPNGCVVADTNAEKNAAWLDEHVYEIRGSAAEMTLVRQDILLNGKKGETVTLGGWAKAPASGVEKNSNFFLRLCKPVTVGGGMTELKTLYYSNTDSKWQYMQQTFLLEEDCDTVSLFLGFDARDAAARFDGVALCKGDAIPEEAWLEDRCACAGCEEFNCTCRCESEAACACPQCKRQSGERYDEYGNLLTSFVTDGQKEKAETYTYTADGNYQLSVSDSGGNTVRSSYDTGTGLLNSVTDARGNRVNYSYNAMRMLTKVSQEVSGLTDASGMENGYTYTDDRLTDISHNGFAYHFSYTPLGELSGLKVGSQSLVEYSYAPHGHDIQKMTFGNGQTVTYRYTGRNITGISYDDGASWAYTYAYNAKNELVKVVDAVNNTVTDYRKEDYSVKSPDGRTTYFSSRSDEDDNYRETVSGAEFVYGHESVERDSATGVTTTARGIQGGGVKLNLRAETDAFDRSGGTSVTLEGSKTGVTAELAYEEYAGNKTGERVTEYKSTLTSQSGLGSSTSYKYAYDENGAVKTITKNGAELSSYTYDEAGQLTQERNNGVTTAYRYDKGGNLRTKTSGGKTITYAYGDANWKDKLTAYNGKAITYDQNGNPLTYDGWTYTWTAGRQLAKMAKAGQTITYQYNRDGLRTKKTVVENGITTETQYVWANGRLLGVKTGTDSLRLLYQGDSPIGFVANNVDVYLYVKNLQGDVTGIADKTGTLVISYAYDAWGNILSQSGDAAIAKLNPITYRGYNYDTETELYYLQSRYYNPDWGRFLNADNAVDTRDGIVSCNTFAYCGNNPIAYIDLTGNSKWTYLRWPGEIHRAVQMHISKKYGYLTEAPIVNATNGKSIGRVDLLS